MYRDSQSELDKIFLSYNKILLKFKAFNIKTKNGKENFGNIFTYYQNNELIISKEGIEWLCKNSFKHKYLELLEKRKMELTEKYIEAGFPYDHFFGGN